MALPTRTQQSAPTIIARLNLAVPPAPHVTPRPWGWSPRAQVGRYVQAAVSQAANAITDIMPPTASNSAVAGPAPGAGGGSGGAPISASAGAAGLASLPPTARTLAKVVPIVAAIFFWNKGDKVLAAVSAAAGAAALMYL